MSWQHPGLEGLPAEFPVFPLPGALLLPRGKLPVNIFEPRYLAMVEDALGRGRMFGMIQPNKQMPAGATGPALFRIGCLGRITQFAETDDGRFLITLTGVCRFSVRDELSIRRGYRRVAADLSEFHADLADPPALPLGARENVMAALKPYFAARRLDANWDAVNAMPDSTLISTLAMVCPFEPAEKQALLEAPTEANRAHDLLALLRMAVHEADPANRPS